VDDEVSRIIGDILAQRGDSTSPLLFPESEPRVDIDAMTPDEREQYFAELIEFSLLARPVVVAGQEFYVGIDWEADVAPEQFELHITVNDIRVGGLRTSCVGSGLRTPLGFSWRGRGLTGYSSSLGEYIELEQPGTWPVELDLEFQIHRADRPSVWTGDGSELYSAKRTLTGEVKVLAEEPPHLFTLTHSPELDRYVAAAVRATDFCPESATWVGGRAQPGLSVQVWFSEPLPIDLAFVAYAEFGNQRLEAERPIVVSAGGRPGSSHGISVTFAHPYELPEAVTLILCASKSVALRTPDMYQIWGGELVFENIRVSESSQSDRRFGDGRYAPTVRHPGASEPGRPGDDEH
jgi:hypothetical protein